VIADASGNITDSFNLPNTFVSDYDVTATGSSGAVATTTFTDAIKADADVTPTLVAGGSTKDFTLTVTNRVTGQQDAGVKLGCAQIQLPASPNNYTGVSIKAGTLNPTTGWQANYNSTTRTVQLNATSDANRLSKDAAVTVQITATAPTTNVNNDDWTTRAFENTACTTSTSPPEF
jgi:hypothetical protein